MILVTGAAGKTGLHALRALEARGLAARALVRRPEQEEIVRRAGASEVQVGDLTDPSDLARACDGVSAIYLVCPNLHDGELDIAGAVMDAALRSGAPHLIYHSVLHPQTTSMPHHWRKLQVEEKVFESGLPFTILQPCAYLQNLEPYVDEARRTGQLVVPFDVDKPFSMVDLRDVAEVVAALVVTVATEPAAHRYATYELCGAPLSHRQVADELGRRFGRPVTARSISIDTWRAAATGLDARRLDELCKMFAYYDRHGFVGGSGVLRSLLGREPRGLATESEA